MPRTSRLPPDRHDLVRRRRRQFGQVAVVAAVGVAVVYLLAVRTRAGQELDDLAFDGRRVEDPDVTRVANDLLHAVTRSSLVLLVAAIVAIALARRQLRLAAVAGATITASVVTTEVLKLHVLERPRFDRVSGIDFNSYPSGHATIAMALALGLLMVVPHHRRAFALVPAGGLAMLFGLGVLATGWHRPSDVVGAFLVCAAWFAAATWFLLWRGTAPAGDPSAPRVPARRGPTAVAVGTLVVAVGVGIFVVTLEDGAVRLVDGGRAYVVVAGVLLVLAVAELAAYVRMLRGLTLDAELAEVVAADAPALAR